MSIDQKQCRNCRLVLTLDDFYRQPSNADQLMTICKKCHIGVIKAARKRRAEEYQAYDRDKQNKYYGEQRIYGTNGKKFSKRKQNSPTAG